jgi:hypothetical protein
MRDLAPDSGQFGVGLVVEIAPRSHLNTLPAFIPLGEQPKSAIVAAFPSRLIFRGHPGAGTSRNYLRRKKPQRTFSRALSIRALTVPMGTLVIAAICSREQRIW